MCSIRAQNVIKLGMGDEKQYFAFISYKREDEEWAKWLANELEHYHLPFSLNGRDDLPKVLKPIFRDVDELSAGNLPKQIHKALKNSKNLIVICSPRSSKSPWVNKEVEEFIGMGKLDRVFPFIIDGIPNSKNEDEECLPKAIINLSEEEERLGVNVSEFKDSPLRLCRDCPLSNRTNRTKAQGDVNEKGRDAALVKIIAGMLGLDFDILWQRYEKEKAEEERKIKEQRDNLLKVQARFVAEKVHQLTEEGDFYAARLLALSILPNNEIPDYPYTAEAEGALRKACSNENKKFTGHKDAISYVAISPDGNTLASASQDNTIRLWDIKTGNCLNIIERPNMHEGHFRHAILDGQISIMNWIGFNSVEFSADGMMLIAAGRDATIYVWDLSTMKCLFRESNAEIYYSVNYATFTPDMKNIIAANYCDGREDILSGISFWSFDNHRIVMDIYGSLETDSIAIDPSEQFYASSSFGEVTIWDSKRLKRLWVFKTGLQHLSTEDKGTVKFSPDGSITAFSIYNQIFIWNTKNKQLLNKIEDSTRINCIAFMPDGKHLISGGENKIVKMWNIISGDCLRQFEGHTGVISTLSVSNDGQFIISAGYDKDIRLWNITNNSLESVDSSLSCNYKTPKKEKDEITQLEFSYDSDSDKITISNVLEYDLGFCMENPYSKEIMKILPSPDNNSLLMMSYDNDVYICINFDSLVEECIRRYNPNSNVYETPCFTVKEQDLVLLSGHTDLIRQASFSPDSKYVLTYADDLTIHIWDVKSGKCVQIIDEESSVYYDSVEFSDDGKCIIANKQGKSRIIKFPSLEQIIAKANESLKDRSLTQREREKYYLE